MALAAYAGRPFYWREDNGYDKHTVPTLRLRHASRDRRETA
jgi:hypothetical protein